MADRNRNSILNRNSFNFLVLGSNTYYKPFFDAGGAVIAPSQRDMADCIVFTGGTDVNPSMYGETRSAFVSSVDDVRDREEKEIFHYALEHGIPMIGICRGAQFLNVMNGGKLVQHITGHTDSHDIKINGSVKFDKRNIKVTSTHHQMMVPDITKSHELLAYGEDLAVQMSGLPLPEYTSYTEKYNGGLFSGKEPEVLWYDTTNSLCVQYHPEYMDKDSDGAKFFQFLIEEFIK